MKTTTTTDNRDFSERTKQLVWFTSGALCGLAMLSICKASNSPSNVPSDVKDDTAIYQSLSEIQIKKEHTPNFDGDISTLSKMETRYKDRPALNQNRVARKAPAKKVVQPRS